MVPPFDLGRLNPMGSLFVTRPSLAHYLSSREELEMRAGDVLGATVAGALGGVVEEQEIPGSGAGADDLR